MLTVQSLVDEMGLELAAGEGARRRAGSLGAHHRAAGPDAVAVGRRAAADHGHPARRATRASASSCACSSGRHLAGLGFGTGFDHDGAAAGARRGGGRSSASRSSRCPTSCRSSRITEKAFARLVNEQYEVLQRGIAIHKRLERLVLEERGLDEVVRALAAAIGGAVAGARRRAASAIASEPFRRQLPDAALDAIARGGRARERADGRVAMTEFAPDHPSWPAARSRCRSRRAAAGRRRPGSSPRATRAGWATSSG